MFQEFSETYDTISTDISDAQYEMLAEDDRKKYVCKHTGCGKFFRYKSEIMRHIATHSESRPFICQYENCFKAFKRNDALENHIRSSHTKETPFTCPFPECGMKFTTHGSFRYHVLKHNKGQVEGDGQTTLNDTLYQASQQSKQVKTEAPSEERTTITYQPIKAKQNTNYPKADKEDPNSEFYTPPPKFAGKIKWEMTTEDVDPSPPVQKKETATYEQFLQILEENKLLKQKLATSEKVVQGMQKQINDLLGNLFVYQSQIAPSPDQYTFTNTQTFPEMNLKSQDPMFINMMNYGEDNALKSPVEIQFPMDGPSIDGFLTFGKDSNPYNF